MTRIFISYRRTDSSGHAELLAERLEDHYPGEVFLDRNRLEDGDRWDKEILAHLNEAEALLVVIGPGWLFAQDKKYGKRRLDDPKDWVRREVQTGLKREILVIPVLVGGAEIPEAKGLPRQLATLAKLEKREIGDKDSGDDVRNLAEILKKKIGAPKDSPTGNKRQRVEDPTSYYRKLHQETGRIEIQNIESGAKAHVFRIDEIYTPLTTTLAGEREMSARRVPLETALKHPKLLLVGNPGAGKSTFLKRLTFALCQTLLNENPEAAREVLGAGDCPFPIRIAASSLSKFLDNHTGPKPADEWSPEWILLALATWSAERNWGLSGESFREQMPRSLLLLDGLDEVPGDARRHNIARMAEEIANAYDGIRVVATSRPSAYGGVTAIPGFERVDIGDLDPPAIETFIANWARALAHGDPDAESDLRGKLHESIHSKPEIELMAANPVMLTQLAVLHWNRQNRLPDKRAELYEAVLRGLAEAREQKPGRLPALQCLEMFRHLAYAMHCHPKGKQVEIGPFDAAAAIAGQMQPAGADAQKAAEAFLRCEETDSGIVISRGNSLCFWHQTFQEFLAAQALAGRDADRERILFAQGGRLHAPDWRETVQLLACVMWKQGTSRVDDLLKRILDTAGGRLDGQARCVGLVGRMLADLKSWGYEIRDPRYKQYLDAVLAVFEKGCKLDFRTRLEAADALGQAGDPRLDRDNWIRVEGGRFWMGAQKTDRKGRNYDEEAYDHEAPVRQEEVKSFWIAKYPVTVQDYRRFVEAGGYEAKRYWTAGGFGKWTEPEQWQQQVRYPSRAVVSVSWYEAMAYCAWAGVRLLKEAEWEHAARCGREGVRYPWGDEKPDDTHANFGRPNDGHATPVGMYPEGDTPNGICDMAGNMWEWINQDYDNSQKVLRGGSWNFNPWFLRVSVRLRYEPVARYGSVGFRCARD